MWFFINHGGSLTGEVFDTRYYPSPIALRGLEIIIKSTFKIDVTKFALLRRLQDIIGKNYKDPSLSKETSRTNFIEPRPRELEDVNKDSEDEL